VDHALNADARYIVTPGISSEVVRRCQLLSVPVIPGVATATELHAAIDAGQPTPAWAPWPQNPS